MENILPRTRTLLHGLGLEQILKEYAASNGNRDSTDLLGACPFRSILLPRLRRGQSLLDVAFRHSFGPGSKTFSKNKVLEKYDAAASHGKSRVEIAQIPAIVTIFKEYWRHLCATSRDSEEDVTLTALPKESFMHIHSRLCYHIPEVTGSCEEAPEEDWNAMLEFAEWRFFGKTTRRRFDPVRVIRSLGSLLSFSPPVVLSMCFQKSC